MSINANNVALNEILSMINNLPSADGSSGGTVYTNIVYNDDNTVTLTDKDGVDHTMVCEYTDGVLSGLTYDGKSVELTYEEDTLVNIGAIEVDMANVPYESGGGDTEEIENLIDQSGVLDSTDGTVEDKVEQLIDKAHLYTQTTVIGFRGNLELTTLSIDCSQFIIMHSFAHGCTNLKTVYISNTQNVIGWNNAFDGTGVEHIYGDIDLSSATQVNNAFATGSIITISFVPKTIKVSLAVKSPYLSINSRQSIFDGLATVTSARTLTLHSTLKILQSQVDSANAKGWTVAGGTVVSEEEYYG